MGRSAQTRASPPPGSIRSGSAPRRQPNDAFAENTGQAYTTFSSSGTSTYTSGTAANNQEAQRLNVVYAGANDGMLHGFESGSFNGSVFQSANNDGKEVLAYVPAYIANTIQSTNGVNNYSDPQYGHKFDVDASPGTGDLFYGGVWHTWVVGGLGPGGNAIYALDITDPATLFTETSGTKSGPTSVVRGEWGTYVTTTVSGSNTTRTVASTTMNCVGDGATPCGNHLGNTYGVPQIRRFHNGSWGAPGLSRRWNTAAVRSNSSGLRYCATELKITMSKDSSGCTAASSVEHHGDLGIGAKTRGQPGAHGGTGFRQHQSPRRLCDPVGMQRLAAAIVEYRGGWARHMPHDGLGEPRIMHVMVARIHVNRMGGVVIRNPVFHGGGSGERTGNGGRTRPLRPA